MGNTRTGKLIVRYVDGGKNKIIFSQPTELSNALKRIEDAVQAQCLMLEMEDRLLVIPMHQIKNLEISPPPDKLPDYALRNVSVVE